MRKCSTLSLREPSVSLLRWYIVAVILALLSAPQTKRFSFSLHYSMKTKPRFLGSGVPQDWWGVTSSQTWQANWNWSKSTSSPRGGGSGRVTGLLTQRKREYALTQVPVIASAFHCTLLSYSVVNEGSGLCLLCLHSSHTHWDFRTENRTVTKLEFALLNHTDSLHNSESEPTRIAFQCNWLCSKCMSEWL